MTTGGCVCRRRDNRCGQLQVDTDCMGTSRWAPDARNRASYGGFVGMRGGPSRQWLPEHEHPELQISVHFGETPRSKLIEPFQPHAGGWDDGETVAVMLLAPPLI